MSNVALERLTMNFKPVIILIMAIRGLLIEDYLTSFISKQFCNVTKKKPHGGNAGLRIKKNSTSDLGKSSLCKKACEVRAGACR